MVETERERVNERDGERKNERDRVRESEMHLLLLGVLHAYTLCYVGAPHRFILSELTHLSLYIILSMYNILCNNILQFARRWAIVDCRLKSDYGERRLLPIYV